MSFDAAFAAWKSEWHIFPLVVGSHRRNKTLSMTLLTTLDWLGSAKGEANPTSWNLHFSNYNTKRLWHVPWHGFLRYVFGLKSSNLCCVSPSFRLEILSFHHITFFRCDAWRASERSHSKAKNISDSPDRIESGEIFVTFRLTFLDMMRDWARAWTI